MIEFAAYDQPELVRRPLVTASEHGIEGLEQELYFDEARTAGINAAHILVRDQMDSNPVAHVALHYEAAASEAAMQKRIAAEYESRDLLTGLYNRKIIPSLYRGLQNENARRIGDSGEALPSSMLMIDLDHFKDVNDTHGHLAGDKVLAHVAGLLQENVRERDVVVRIGGEEIAIILPRASIENAMGIAEKLRQLIADNPATISRSMQLHVTASIGATELNLNDDYESNYDRVDKALYVAKEQGRNRVIASSQLDANGEFVIDQPVSELE